MSKDQGRLGWLTAALGTHKRNLMKLLQRIGDLGSLQGMKPKIFTKFLNLMEQVAHEHDEEVKLISEIEAIERKHRFQRKSGKLKRAAPKDKFAYDAEFDSDPRPRNGWLWAIAFWYLMTRRGPRG